MRSVWAGELMAAFQMASMHIRPPNHVEAPVSAPKVRLEALLPMVPDVPVATTTPSLTIQVVPADRTTLTIAQVLAARVDAADNRLMVLTLAAYAKNWSAPVVVTRNSHPSVVPLRLDMMGAADADEPSQYTHAATVQLVPVRSNWSPTVNLSAASAFWKPMAFGPLA